jgi:hypothetical protein
VSYTAFRNTNPTQLGFHKMITATFKWERDSKRNKKENKEMKDIKHTERKAGRI